MAQKIDYAVASPEAIEASLGRKLEQLRLSKNVNQSALAAEAGVSRRTITRLENGEGISLDTLIRVMRALGVVDRLASLLPDPATRPVERIKLGGRERKRARMKNDAGADAWTWGPENDEHDRRARHTVGPRHRRRVLACPNAKSASSSTCRSSSAAASRSRR